ncbi:MAG: protein TolR [Gammaproteobacteria bacterium]|nr:protein TolR [Gammaproteobacteria bacterium]
MAQGSRRRRPMSEINVVPYIDVMLVLLIIFMVTAPLLTQGVKVDLPQASAEPVAANDPQTPPLVVSIDRSGQIFLNRGATPEAPLVEAVLRSTVAAELARNPSLPVLVKGDRAVPYGRVIETIAALQAAGAARVGFLTEPATVDDARR